MRKALHLVSTLPQADIQGIGTTTCHQCDDRCGSSIAELPNYTAQPAQQPLTKL